MPRVRAAHTSYKQQKPTRYKGRPHWGKNYDRTYTHPNCPVRDALPAATFTRLAELQATYDPRRVFEPPLWTALTQRQAHGYSLGCAARGACYCASTLHCALGYACVPSKAFPEYKVCKPALEL